MKRSGRRSTNIDDRRGQRMAGAGGGVLLLLRFLPFLIRTKVGRVILLVGGGLYVASYMGFLDLGVPGLQGTPQGGEQVAVPAEQQELADFVSIVLADTEDTWQELFAAQNANYVEPTLVLFTGVVNSACGQGQADMGPFYCPADQSVYIDLSFYDALRTRHGAAGDFAQAYVIAHEVGHHVQTLTGVSSEVSARMRSLPEEQANQMSVRQELQADCFAGLWAYHANRLRQILEDGDVEEALTAAAAIGDDRLQQQGQGYAQPETFTHGTSEQRIRWFRRGLEQGSLEACDTFASAQL